MNFLRPYLAAVQSFTRVPVTGTLAQWAGSSPDNTLESAAHFPGVGWLVGIVACAAFALVGLLLPGTLFAALAAAVGCIVATVMLTGGVHENSLARVADGLGAPVSAARALEIMRDSRIGGFGVLALVLVLLGKVFLLAVLAAQSPVAVLVALLAGHVVSRFWPLFIARGVPGMPGLAYLGDTTPTGNPLSGRIGNPGLGIAATWSLAALAIAWLAQGPAFAIVPVVASGLALFGMQRLFARRLQGFTDDALGATQQVCEIAFYFGAAIGVQVA